MVQPFLQVGRCTQVAIPSKGRPPPTSIQHRTFDQLIVSVPLNGLSGLPLRTMLHLLESFHLQIPIVHKVPVQLSDNKSKVTQFGLSVCVCVQSTFPQWYTSEAGLTSAPWI